MIRRIAPTYSLSLVGLLALVFYNTSAFAFTHGVLLTEGDHVVVFSAPATTNLTEFVYMTTKPNATATATVPDSSGWGYGSEGTALEELDREILIDRCDDDSSIPSTMTNNSFTIGYHGSPRGTADYSFVTFIDDGVIDYCHTSGSGGGRDRGSGRDNLNEFTLLITDFEQFHFNPDPVVALKGQWVEISAYRYTYASSPEDPDSDYDETPVDVYWSCDYSHVDFSTEAGDGGLLSDEALESTARSSVWVKADLAGKYPIKADADPGSSSDDDQVDFYSVNHELLEIHFNYSGSSAYTLKTFYSATGETAEIDAPE